MNNKEKVLVNMAMRNEERKWAILGFMLGVTIVCGLCVFEQWPVFMPINGIVLVIGLSLSDLFTKRKMRDYFNKNFGGK